jgi:NADH dehydrogenase
MHCCAGGKRYTPATSLTPFICRCFSSLELFLVSGIRSHINLRGILMTANKKTRIVIVGGGFGGAYCAQYLERQAKNTDIEIFLLDRNNYFTFYPLLVEAGTGHLEPRHTVVSIRQFLRRTHFIMGEVFAIDFGQNKVRYMAPGGQGERSIDYDQIVLALGSETNLHPVPGLREHAFQIKSMTDAITLRDRAIRLLEAADIEADPAKRRALLHFVVVGANFTGVEVAGEFEAFIKEASRRYANVEEADCKVTLVEREERILNAIDSDLAAYATEKMRQRGVDVYVGRTVHEITADHIILDDEQILTTHTVVWAAGIVPNRLIAALQVPTDTRGYIVCDHGVMVKGYTNVWAIGDSAINPDPDGKPYPATAQHAIGAARYVAEAIVRRIKGQALRPFVIQSRGALAALGCRTAVAKVFGIKLSGFPAWFLWRTVYLLKMPGMTRKVRVAIDWTLGLLFRREYVQLGVHKKVDAGQTSEAKPPIVRRTRAYSESTV